MKKMPITKLSKEAIYSFVEGGGTLEQLAERYSCSEVTFMSSAKKKLGKGGWKKITHQSNENARKQDKQERAEEAKEEVMPLEEEQSTFYYSEESEENLKSRQEELKQQFNSILEDFKQSQEVAKEADEIITIAKQQIASAKELIAEAIKEFEHEEKRQSQFAFQLKELEKENEEIEKKLSETREIILVAPNYRGELPQGKKLISTVKISEKVEVAEMAEVQITATVSEMLKSGFETIQEYADAMRFVALCGEYKKGGKKHRILVDDERVEYILNNLVSEE